MFSTATSEMTETSGLSTSALRTLANTFTGPVIDYILKDEAFVEYLMDIVPQALSQTVGTLAEGDDIELAMMVMEKITLKEVPF
jgi:hypothetical protein